MRKSVPVGRALIIYILMRDFLGSYEEHCYLVCLYFVDTETGDVLAGLNAVLFSSQSSL